MNQTYPRKWAARITVSSALADLCHVHPNGDRVGETVDATPSRNDLQKDQLAAAYREAAEYILAGLGTCACVQLYKTTQAHGRQADKYQLISTQDAEAYARRSILASVARR
jgi:hypothetical protein